MPVRLAIFTFPASNRKGSRDASHGITSRSFDKFKTDAKQARGNRGSAKYRFYFYNRDFGWVVLRTVSVGCKLIIQRFLLFLYVETSVL